MSVFIGIGNILATDNNNSKTNGVRVAEKDVRILHTGSNKSSPSCQSVVDIFPPDVISKVTPMRVPQYVY